MTHTFLRLAAGTAALALTLCACGRQTTGVSSASASSASSAASSAAESQAASAVSDVFKASDQYDYASFDYSAGIDASGLWEGVTASDYVTLPADYNAIPIPEADVTPTDSEIQSAVNDIVSNYTAAALGDTVNIDYSGSVGGVAFQGGTAQGYDLTLGSGTFISGFEDQIVGHKKGETFDVTVTFPAGYSDAADAAGNTVKLAGQEAVFTVKINSITFGWELTDAWVAQNLEANYDVTTVADLKAYVSATLLNTNRQNYALNYLLQNATFADAMPEAVTDYMVCQFLSYYSSVADYYGESLSDYFASYGYASVDAALAEAEDSILTAVHKTLVYQAVAEAAGITLDTSRLADYASYLDSYGQNYLNQYLLDQQVLESLVKSAVAG